MKEGMIGLEVHVYLVSKEKLFCKCKAVREKGTPPNKYICPICTGQPGAKPMLPNKSAVEKCVKIALMLNCEIEKKLNWQRKHYDWPDLPKGYQNTISGKGVTLGRNGNFFGVRVRGVHLEEDPAAWDPLTGRVDYNRSGLPLVEIITEPDFSTAEQVRDWLGKLLWYLQYLRVIGKDAGLKADVNVNIPEKTERVEVKNLNSIENIARAIEYELERQAREGSNRETRRFDEHKGKTIPMREKEQAQDYRFITDPDLPPILLTDSFVRKVKASLPETPEEKLNKLVKHYHIDEKNAEILARNIELVEFFEELAQKVNPQFALPWVTIELLRHLNYHKTTLAECEIKVEHFARLLELVQNKTITPLKAKEILNKFYPKSFYVEGDEESARVDDAAKIREWCEEVVKENNDVVAKYKSGEEKAINFLIGEVMKKSGKRADFKVVREVLKELLEQ